MKRKLHSIFNNLKTSFNQPFGDFLLAVFGLIFTGVGAYFTVTVKINNFGNIAFILMGCLLFYIGISHDRIESINSSGIKMAGLLSTVVGQSEPEDKDTAIDEAEKISPEFADSLQTIVDRSGEDSNNQLSTVKQSLKAIKKEFADHKITVSNNHNVLTLTEDNETTRPHRYNALLSASSNYDKTGFCSGWNVLNRNNYEEKDFDYYIMTVADDTKVNIFILTKSDMGKVIKQKNLTKNGYYHFYINNKQGKWFDSRDGNNISFERYHNNWGAITRTNK